MHPHTLPPPTHTHTHTLPPPTHTHTPPPTHTQGASKDIQTLFTAIDRRIQALKRNVLSDNTEQATDPSEPPNTTAILRDDEEDKYESISRQSSPDSSPEAIRVRAIERPPVISVSNVDRVQRSRSSEPSTDEGSYRFT